MGGRRGPVVVDAAALDRAVAAAVGSPAWASSPVLREALAALMSSTRPVGPERPWLSMAEAADALGVSVRTVRRRVKAGELSCRREGRRVLIPASSMREQ